jgi:hypothetical protein
VGGGITGCAPPGVVALGKGGGNVGGGGGSGGGAAASNAVEILRESARRTSLDLAERERTNFLACIMSPSII